MSDGGDDEVEKQRDKVEKMHRMKVKGQKMGPDKPEKEALWLEEVELKTETTDKIKVKTSGTKEQANHKWRSNLILAD